MSRARPNGARAGVEAGTDDAWDVYIARCADDTLYTGIAKQAGTRIEQHNLGRGARYTRGRGPVELVYRERVAGRGPALRREAEIKGLSAADKRRLIASDAARAGDARGARAGPALEDRKRTTPRAAASVPKSCKAAP